MDTETIKEYYTLLSMLAVIIKAMEFMSEKEHNYFTENLLTVSEYIHHELLRFGINNIGEVEKSL